MNKSSKKLYEERTANVGPRNDKVWKTVKELGGQCLNSIAYGVDGVCVDIVQVRCHQRHGNIEVNAMDCSRSEALAPSAGDPVGQESN